MAIEIILATNSERRHELFRGLGLSFKITESGFDETEIMNAGLSPRETVEAIAEGKLRSVMGKYPGALVITADTIVCLNGKIIGKPEGEAGSYEILRFLSGKTHEVCTGVAYSYNGEIRVLSESAAVSVKNLSDGEIRGYIATGEPMGKAGAYNAGGLGAAIIERIDGGLSTVMGLPMELVARELGNLGLL